MLVNSVIKSTILMKCAILITVAKQFSLLNAANNKALRNWPITVKA